MPTSDLRSIMSTDVPALLVRTGAPKWDYGALATARTLGRLGVPVFVLAETSERDLRSSRYVTATVGPPLAPQADPVTSVNELNAIAAALGSRCVVVAGDDESAVTLAEQQHRLDTRLLMLPIAPGLPRRLSDKVALGNVARAADVPYPRFTTTSDPATLRSFADEVGFPLVVKSPAPYSRLTDEAVAKTTIIKGEWELGNVMALALRGYQVFAQEYLARPGSKLWYAAGVSLPSRGPDVVWTGRKCAAHPSGTGVGVVSIAADNPALAAHMQDLCRHLGYTGAFDSDWVVDTGAQTAHLVDFNPRRGAQFKLFHTTTELDVVRALHLAVTGHPIPWGEQIFGTVQIVENLAILQGSDGRPGQYRTGGSALEWSWWAPDDVRPGLVMAAQMAAAAGRKVGRSLSRVQ